MQPNTKLVNLELNYELSKAEEKDLNPDEKGVSNITRNLVNQAFTGNYAQGMEDKISKQWRSIRRVLDYAVEEEKTGFAIFSLSDFDSVYDEVHKCKYNPMMARFEPYLSDELNLVKHRSNEDEEKVQDDMEELKKAAAGLKIAGNV